MFSKDYQNFPECGSLYSNDLRDFNISKIIPEIDLNKDPEAYKLERLCKICLITLKPSKLQIRNKLHSCKFCFDAVCDSCSPAKVYQSNFKKEKRVCVSCINTAITNVILVNLEIERQNTKKYLQEQIHKGKEEIMKEQEFLSLLVEIYDLRNSELLETNNKIEELKRSIRRTQFTIDDRQNEIFDSTEKYESELRTLKELEDTYRYKEKSLQAMKVRLKKLEDKEKELSYYLHIKLTEEPQVLKTNQKEELLNTISGLQDIAYAHKRDIFKLRQEIEGNFAEADGNQGQGVERKCLIW